VNNILTRVEGVVNDITERKNAEAALLINEQRLDQIYNTVSDIIFMVTLQEDGRFQFASVNLSFLKSTGLDKELVIGKYLDEVIPPASFNFVNEKYNQCITEKKAAVVGRWSTHLDEKPVLSISTLYWMKTANVS